MKDGDQSFSNIAEEIEKLRKLTELNHSVKNDDNK